MVEVVEVVKVKKHVLEVVIMIQIVINVIIIIIETIIKEGGNHLKYVQNQVVTDIVQIKHQIISENLD